MIFPFILNGFPCKSFISLSSSFSHSWVIIFFFLSLNTLQTLDFYSQQMVLE